MTDEEKKELQRQKRREYMRNYRIKNADVLAEKRKHYETKRKSEIQKVQLQYRIKHAEQLKEYGKQYRKIHAEEIAQYREENRDALRERNRLFWKENSERLHIKQKERRDNGKIKTIKVVYFGETNPEVLRLRKHLSVNHVGTSAYIKHLIETDLKHKGIL